MVSLCGNGLRAFICFNYLTDDKIFDMTKFKAFVT